jgi:hypothetical protein
LCWTLLGRNHVHLSAAFSGAVRLHGQARPGRSLTPGIRRHCDAIFAGQRDTPGGTGTGVRSR